MKRAPRGLLKTISIIQVLAMAACGWPAMPEWPPVGDKLEQPDGGQLFPDGGIIPISDGGVIQPLDGGTMADVMSAEDAGLLEDGGRHSDDGGLLPPDAADFERDSGMVDANDIGTPDAGERDSGIPDDGDRCQLQGLYGDGECHLDCPLPDADCDVGDAGNARQDGGDGQPFDDAGVSPPIECDEGFHVESLRCEPNSRACSLPGGDGRQEWNDGWGDCRLQSCWPDFHRVQDRCEANERECFISNGTGLQIWRNGRWATCEPVSCNTGYHLDSGRCISNTRACPIPNGSGRETWLGNQWSACQLVICYAGFHVEEGACLSNTKSCDVPNGSGVSRWENGSWGQCSVQICDEGFHIENGGCASDYQACEIDFGAGQREWNGQNWGICIPTECDAGYHVEDNRCESNQRACPIANGDGEQNWNNGDWGLCEPTACLPGFHIESYACENDMRVCPVPNGNGFQRWESPGWGLCIPDSCHDNFHDGGNGSCVDIGQCAEGFALDESGKCVPNARAYESHFDIMFALIPQGIFERGSPTEEPGRSEKNEKLNFVELTQPFALSITEITQAQWQALTDAMPAAFFDCGLNCPVEQLDWYSALAFANALSLRDGFAPCYDLQPSSCADETTDWADGQSSCTSTTFSGTSCSGYRLPTEAEWEYAYRAKSTTAFYSGEIQQVGTSPLDVSLDSIGWYGGNSTAEYASAFDCSGWGPGADRCGPQPVKRKNSNSWGLFDMSGNVSEWIWDGFADYPLSSTDPVGAIDGETRVVRGGAWDSAAAETRAASRAARAPNDGTSTIGFRLARTLPACATGQDDGRGVCVESGVCAAGFHWETHYCVPDLRGCLLANGVGEERWDENSWSECQLSHCFPGFHDDGTGKCVDVDWCAFGFQQNEEGECVKVPPDLPHLLGIEFAFIPAGTFTMGTPSNELGRLVDEAPHDVMISYNFAMSTTEITQSHWQQVSKQNPSHFESCGDECPVENIDWFSALAYANRLSDAAGLERCYALSSCEDPSSGWHDGAHDGCDDLIFVGPSCLGYRLPTEAEWEYAYRAMTTSAYYSGPNSFTNCSIDSNLDKIGWYCGNSEATTQPVGQKQPNSWGLFDVAGNVREWTSDWYAAYQGEQTDPTGPATGTNPVVRGGSWQLGAGNARAGRRTYFTVDGQSSEIGFRLVRTLLQCPTGQRDGGGGECVAAETCASGFHAERNLCVPDLRGCSLENGRGLQSWTAEGWGACQLLECLDGYQDGGDANCVPADSCSPGYAIDDSGICQPEECTTNLFFPLNELPTGATYSGGAIPNRGAVDLEQQCWSQTSDWQNLRIPVEEHPYREISFQVVRGVERQSAYVSFQGVNLRFGIDGFAECNHDCHASADYANAVAAFVWSPEEGAWVGQWSALLTSSPIEFNEYKIVFDPDSDQYAVYENDLLIGGGNHPATLGADAVNFGATAPRFQHAGTCWKDVNLYACP